MAEEKLSILKKKRGLVKGQLSKFTTFIEKFNDHRKLTELGARLEKAEQLWSDFDKIQTEIELEDDSDAQKSHRDVFETAYFSVVGTARELKQAGANAERPQPQAEHTCANQNIKLPTLKLPEFNGEYDKWIQFNDTFRAIIHNNNTLTTTQKFYYLRSCLGGDAARAFDTLEASDANYDIAWDILKRRFENRNIIVHNHVKALFELPQVTKDSHVSLRSLYDNMSQHLQALESLGQPIDSWDSLIIYLVSSKLDSTSRSEWEKLSVKRNELPSLDSFKTFLNERCQILERLSNDGKQSDKRNAFKDSKDKAKGNSLSHLSSNAIKCEFCKGSHSVYLCKDILSLPVDQRLMQIKKLKLCTNCLRNNHFFKDCKAGGCKKCNGRHNTLLHFDKPKVESETSVQAVSSVNNDKSSVTQASTIATHVVQVANNSYILLATARVIIFDSNGEPHQCRALLDNGSQSNFATKQLIQKLGLAKTPVRLPVSGVNQSITNISHKTNASIKSLYNDYKAELSFLVVDNIAHELPNRFYNISTLNIPEGLSLADPRFNYPESVDLLIGAGIFWGPLCAGQIQLGNGKPFLQKTKLGWIISGPMAPTYKKSESLCHLNTVQEVRDNLERFWEIEECLPVPKFTREEAECEALFVKTTVRDEQGRFTVHLPFRTNVDKLGDSLNNAIKRFYALDRRLSKNPILKEQYVQFMNEYQQLGHMTEIAPNDGDRDAVYYLPHHSVVKELSTTTKVRVVFNGSAKTSSGLSLNDILLVGPIIQDDYHAILTRFRIHPYVFTADAEKMYRQVNVYLPHRKLQRIVWRADEREPLRYFQLNTLTYGTGSASFLAIRSVQQTAKDKRDKFPEACTVILEDSYVDDVASGSNTIKGTIQLARDVDTVMSSGCFHLRKWNSNSKEILNALQSEPGTSQMSLSQDSNSKTLGLSWNTDTDSLNYQTSKSGNRPTRITKRTVLSFVAQLFDPLGLVSPTIVLGKIIMQKIWQLGLGWDESLPLDIVTSWNHFCEDMKHINEISVPRHVLCHQCINVQLHGFSDASEIAYGACIYVRSVDHSGSVTTKLLCAKSRVAPLKTISLPRLELCGALLLARLHQLVEAALSRLNLNHDSFYWCDSTIVLAWIATEASLLKIFIANRIAEIQRLTNSNRWFHVSSGENPADIVSRGASLGTLATSQLWWNGPPWLALNSEHWPITDTASLPAPLELKANKIVCATLQLDQDLFNRFSSFMKLLRVTAYCLRFIHNAKNSVDKRCVSALSSDELNESLVTLTRVVQSIEFAPEINAIEGGKALPSSSKILSLNPILDERRILRVGGRLSNSDLSYEHKHPMLIPSNHVFTRLIIMHEHKRQMHAGLQEL